MAFNNGFPTNYPQMYYPQPIQPTQQNQNSNMIWVQGEAGAKSYLVAPNTTIQLWDSEAQTIYLKSADASGMPSIKILDYTIRNAESPHTPLKDDSPSYATIDEIESLKTEITALKKKIDTLTKKRKEAEDE